MTEFTLLEVQLIRSSLTSKSDGEIAALLERPIEEVHLKIDEITGGGAAARSQRIQEVQEVMRKQAQEKEQRDIQKRQARRERELRREAENKERTIRNQNEEIRQKKKREWESRQKFKTRDLRLDTLQSVRIDEKTIVFVKPGANIDAIKKQYTRNLEAQFKNSKN